MKTKVCTKCGVKKFLNEFYKRKEGRIGVFSECKVCLCLRNRKWQADNPGKGKSKWHIKNRKKAKEFSQKWRFENPEKIKDIAHRWRNKNIEYLKKYQQEYYKNKKKDPAYKLNKAISWGVWSSLKGNKKNKQWEDLVGYTLKDLKQYIEKLFLVGMTWDNYGEWHLDHKIPKSVFNFTKPEHEDFKKCWALSNLQPMWAEDNLKKHVKLTKHFQPGLLM